MKKQLFISIIIILIGPQCVCAQDLYNGKKPTIISMKEAINKGIVQTEVYGAYNPRYYVEILDRDGMHYGKCMAAILKSNIDSLILLKLSCGTLLVPDDDSVQKMIVTHDVEFPLYPNSTYAARFYAMCTEIHKRPPNIITSFQIGEMADSSLQKLVKYIESTYMQNMVGQDAVWAYTDQVCFDSLKNMEQTAFQLSKQRKYSILLNL